jgi:hypothetical protein
METTYETIDREIAKLDLPALTAKTAVRTQWSRMERLVTIYRAVRPLLAAAAALPIFPPRWRDALKLFTTTMDDLASGVASGEFKAGKDL